MLYRRHIILGKNNNKVAYVLLYCGIIVFSFTSVLSKIASNYEVFSGRWFLFYGMSILSMGIYAIIWQQVLKTLPLTTAYANRAVTIVLSIIWGAVFFQEALSIRIIIGAIIICTGVVMVSIDNAE